MSQFPSEEEFSLYYQCMEAYEAENPSPVINEESHTGCKHEGAYFNDDFFAVICEECGEILKDRCHERQFINERSQMNYKSANPPHCTLKYFQKKILDFDIEYDEEWLLTDFITQERALEETIFSEDYDIKRLNSLSVKYKLHKLLQHQGIIDTEIPLLKTKHIRLEHDRIMKIVWDKLNWDWID